VANTFLTPSEIAKESIRMLSNSMVMGNLVYRDYDRELQPKKVGTTISVRTPLRFAVTETPTISLSTITDSNVDVVLTTQAHVAFPITSQDMTLKVDEFADRIIGPAMNTIANSIDAAGCDQYKYVNNLVGTAGSTPDSFADLALASERLDDQSCPPEERRAVLNPAAHWKVAGALSALNVQKPAEMALRKGYLGRIAGLDCYMDQNVKTHTVGTGVTTSAVSDGSAQTGATITTDGWTAGTTLTAGEVITFAGSYAVNPISGATLPYLKQFVVSTLTTTVTAASDTDIVVSPAVVASGAYKNVSQAIADGSAIVKVGTTSTGYPQNLVFHKNALCLATAPLKLPMGAPYAEQKTYKGLSVRVIYSYDSTNDQDICRLDVLYGWKTLDQNLITRLIG
jgi:hypothetical protein